MCSLINYPLKAKKQIEINTLGNSGSAALGGQKLYNLLSLTLERHRTFLILLP